MNLIVHPETWYDVECYYDGVLAWRDRFHNLVTTAGLNKLLDATLVTGSAAPTWYVGLVTSTSFVAFAASDTMASHSGWVESQNYSGGVRPTWTPGTISAGSVNNGASKATFNMSASDTIIGCFMANSSTLGGTTGTLYGVGSFSQNYSVTGGAQLLVSVTVSVQ